jgi:hypothetical protein
MSSTVRRKNNEYITERVNYYNRLRKTCDIDETEWNQLSIRLKDQKITSQKVYYLDSMTLTYYFPNILRWRLLPGDITYVPTVPSIVKSRPIGNDNANSVLLKMDKVRHFIFIKDKIPFVKKLDKAIFRGKVKNLDNRILFMNKFFDNSRFDCGAIDKNVAEWVKPKISIYDHLKYRYIMSLEGNDVASNLKWIMSSNSIAVTPRLRNESWFMEGKLIPDYHYIEVRPDFSDLEQKLDYYSSHIDEANAIIAHAHEYVEQFKDKKREKIISLLVLEKYFNITNS